MTRHIRKQAACAWCRVPQAYSILASTNTFGATDLALDGRPGGMARTACLRAVAQCSSCGYCSGDLAERAGHWDHRSDDAYQRLLGDTSIDVLARRWLCRSRIEEEAGELERAAESAMHAAWAGDDVRDRAASERGRSDCARLLTALPTRSPSETLRLIDVLRVLRRRDQAAALLDDPTIVGRTPSRVIDAQRRLIAARDDAPMAMRPDGTITRMQMRAPWLVPLALLVIATAVGLALWR